MQSLGTIFKDNCNILVIDDDSTSSKRLNVALKTMGANVNLFFEADDAIEYYKKNLSTIIFIGTKCGSMSGLELIEILKNLDAKQSLVLMFEREESILLAEALDIGVSRFIQKPLQMKKLQSLVLEISDNITSQEQILKKGVLLEEYKLATDKAFIVSVTDANGIITSVNSKFCDVTGYKKDELVGKSHLLIANRKTTSEDVIREMWQTINSLKVWHGRLFDFTKTGQEIIFETVITPILDEKGRLKEFIAFRQDVTEFVRIGRELKQREQSQRLRDLTIQRKHEKDLIKAKDAFLVVFTHELKTPLNSIINFSEHISKQLKKEDFKKRDRLLVESNIIKESGREMLSNIENLLDASKMKDGTLEATLTTVYLCDMLDTVEVHFKDMIKINSSKLLIKCSDNCKIETDYEKLNKILTNLLSNAIKYSNGTIILSVKCKDDGFEISIEDNGDGIEDTSKVFELFEQGDSDTMKRESKGTGVGLYVVGMMCELLHIEIELSRSERLGGLCARLNGKNIYIEDLK